MCPNTASTSHPRDGIPRTHSRRPLRVAAASPSRLLRAGQNSRCRQCGNRIDLYQRIDQRPIALHPTELATADVPLPCRWHLSGGIAHPHGDGSPWCRIPHAVLCPSRTAPARVSPRIEATRRQFALRTRRLIDAGAITQAPPTACEPSANSGRPGQAVVQLLLGRYLAECPIEDIRCVAQTRQRHRCPHPILDPRTPAGVWTLLPTGPHHGQLALPDALMAVYDLSRLPYAEQLRWRTQRCPAHAAAPGAADLALAGWQVFDPLLHAAHIHTRLPHPPPTPPAKPPQGGMTMPHHALEITLTRPLAPAELHPAARVLPLAANHDATRLMALVRARTPGRAADRLRQRLDTQLPIDVITTHYPDADGQILLNVAFPPATYTAIRHAADRAGQSTERFVTLALHRALAQHASDEADRLDRAVQQLLAHTTAAHLLSAVGHALTRTPGASQC